MSETANLKLIADGIGGIIRSMLGLNEIDRMLIQIDSTVKSIYQLETQNMIKTEDLLNNVGAIGTAIAELSVTLANESEEIKGLFAKSSTDDAAISEATSRLADMTVQLGKIKDTAAGMIPNIETPTEPTEPTAPLPPATDPGVELPQGDIPIDVSTPDSGIDGAPALDFA